MNKPWDLSERTIGFAVSVFQFCKSLRAQEDGRDIARQLRRAAGSVGANYRSARRAKSTKDFATKLGTVIEEADEVCFWLELAVRVDLATRAAVRDLLDESSELVAIFTSAQKTARSRLPPRTGTG